MRIQHNIMAMNAYRNYNNNTSALGKNLEKLSSGYKINRAGDDAAGLAISEKMRAQITGLEAAQKNVKDGISLVKTAEGAMQEIQDMLNRMDYLATQSANGTYQDEVDREALQQEVDQLRTEINRIADSANFNGIKLLDGSLDPTARKAVTTTTFSDLKASTNVNGTQDAVTKFGGPNSNGSLVLTGGDLAKSNGAMDVSDDSVRYHKDAAESGKTSFTVDFDGMEVALESGTAIEGLIFGLDSGTTPNGANNTATGTKNNCLFINEKPSTDIEDDKLTYTVTGNNNKVTSQDIADAIMKSINDNGGKVYIEPAGGGDGKRIEYEVTQDGDKLTFTMTDHGYQTAAALQDAAGNTNNYFQGNFNIAADYKASTVTGLSTEEKAFIADLSDALRGNSATCNINEGRTPAGTIYAQAYIRFDNAGATNYNKAEDIIADGKGFQFGDQSYVFAGSDVTFNNEYADNVHVVDIRGLDMTDADDLRTALTRLSVAANDNEMFDVQVGKTDGAGNYYLVLNERTTYSGDANLTETNYGLENQIKTFENSVSNTVVTRENGTAMNLQIGDTSDAFNQMKVEVGDMHTDAMGTKGGKSIADINIGTSEGAQEAVDVIKNAINYVSSVRGNLGAYQNRLEHTQNNLSVMAENITDAESTIRDTDVAEEMMSYVKNNILVQSAQAMLAQANQVPQGVLQLLG